MRDSREHRVLLIPQTDEDGIYLVAECQKCDWTETSSFESRTQQARDLRAIASAHANLEAMDLGWREISPAMRRWSSRTRPWM
ncbi:hypothetical protein [Catelliglobosispora koreensis]|uniref:hypothetical protein n=1 Tax=Catelliglobosispora koreensis TaxID=129052 RepID=UPI00037FFBCE|nr:hypothetical protein [Catelliglobosispora koreensis]